MFSYDMTGGTGVFTFTFMGSGVGIDGVEGVERDMKGARVFLSYPPLRREGTGV